MISDIVLSTIERKGWQVTPIGGGWKASQPELSFYLSFTPSWVCFQRPLDLPVPEDDAARVQLYRALLRKNETMFMAKYSLDRRRAPVLLVEIPQGGSPYLLDCAIDALRRYGEDSSNLPPAQPPDELPGLPAEVIAYYLRAVEAWGWGAQRKPKGATWPLIYKGRRQFDVYFTVTRSWAYFHAPALPAVAGVESTASIAIQKTFLEYLLDINSVWYMAKTGLNDSGIVFLLLELPTQEMDFEIFRRATRTLSTYLDTYAREIQIMSNLQADLRLVKMLATG